MLPVSSSFLLGHMVSGSEVQIPDGRGDRTFTCVMCYAIKPAPSQLLEPDFFIRKYPLRFKQSSCVKSAALIFLEHLPVSFSSSFPFC